MQHSGIGEGAREQYVPASEIHLQVRVTHAPAR
jgi:hypothetical protein